MSFFVKFGLLIDMDYSYFQILLYHILLMRIVSRAKTMKIEKNTIWSISGKIEDIEIIPIIIGATGLVKGNFVRNLQNIP